MELVGINTESKSYLLGHPHGFSCIGFQVAFKQATAVAEWLDKPTPNPDLIGTERGYLQYSNLMEAGRTHHSKTGKVCEASLDTRFTRFYQRGERVEVDLRPGFEQFYGYGLRTDGKKQRFWVGRSTGWMPIYLQVLNTLARGGEAICSQGIQSVRGTGKFKS